MIEIGDVKKTLEEQRSYAATLESVIENIVRSTAMLKSSNNDYKIAFNARGDFKRSPDGWSITKSRFGGGGENKLFTVNYPAQDVRSMTWVGFLEGLFSCVTKYRYVNQETSKKIITSVASAITDLQYQSPKDREFIRACNYFIEIFAKRKLVNEFPGTLDTFRTAIKEYNEYAEPGALDPLSEYFIVLDSLSMNEIPKSVSPEVSPVIQKTLSGLSSLLSRARMRPETALDKFIKDFWGDISTLLDSDGDDSQQQSQPKARPQTLSRLKDDALQQGDDKKDDGEQKENDSLDSDEMRKPSTVIEKVAQKGEQDKQAKSSKEEPEDYKNAGVVLLDDDLNPRKRPPSIRGSSTYPNLVEQVRTEIHYFQTRLGNILRDNRLSRQGGSFRTGILTKNKLYRVLTNSDKVFTRKIVRKNKSYAVTLLVDNSGSMTGDDLRQASLSTILLAEVLNHCNIPFEIIGFHTTMNYFKQFSDPFNWVIKRNLEAMYNHNVDLGVTSIEYPLNEAVHRIRKQNVDNRIIILLTDGCASPSGVKLPKHAIERLKKQGYKNVENYDDLNFEVEVKMAQKHAIVLAVGIGTTIGNKLRANISDTAILANTRQLPVAILGLLKKHIRRS